MSLDHMRQASDAGDGLALPEPVVTLRDIVSRLEPLLDVAVAPHGLGVPVRRVALYDPEDADALGAGDLILGIGLSHDDAGAACAVRRGPAALVLRQRRLVPELDLAARGTASAILLASPTVSWSDLHAATGVAFAPLPVDTSWNGEDLFQLCDILAELVGGPVAIEDADFHVLAYSRAGAEDDESRREAILGRRTPEAWLRWLARTGVQRRLRTTGEVVTIDEGAVQPGARQRLVLGVHAGTQLTGIMWASAGPGGFRPRAQDTLRDFSRLVALWLLRQRLERNIVQDRHAQLLRPLLEHTGPVEDLASALGISPDETAVVVSMRCVEPQPSGTVTAPVSDFVALQFESLGYAVAAFRQRDGLYLLIPLSGELPVLEAAVRVTAERAQAAVRLNLLFGIGRVTSLPEIHKSRRDADRVVQVLRQGGRHGMVATIADVGHAVTLLEVQEFLRDHRHLMEGKLDALAAHDSEHGTEYLASLAAYLEELGDVRRAAGILHVHPNSFRYRLRRVIELSGIDLCDADERLAAQLQIRARLL